jgi:hypothetical protein
VVLDNPPKAVNIDGPFHPKIADEPTPSKQAAVPLRTGNTGGDQG